MAGRISTLLVVIAILALSARAHMVITYPGWRGNNLITNGTEPQLNPNSIGIDWDSKNDTPTFPYGMAWMYPCGGMPMTENRTKWPYGGGALSVQPGWFPGHAKALMYVNIGITAPGELAPSNYSLPVVPPFQISGPSDSTYPGQFCLPQVRMPAGVSLAVNDNITIQVVEAAQHGAALYSCVDVTLVEPKDAEPVTPQNCYNSSDIGFSLVFTTEALTSDATSSSQGPTTVLLVCAIVAAAMAFVL